MQRLGVMGAHCYQQSSSYYCPSGNQWIFSVIGLEDSCTADATVCLHPWHPELSMCSVFTDARTYGVRLCASTISFHSAEGKLPED